MKSKFIVFMREDKGNFLWKYKQQKNGILPFEASFIDDPLVASKIAFDSEGWEDDEEQFTHLAKAFDSVPVIVEAEYTLKTLEGDEIELTEKVFDLEGYKREAFEKAIRDIFKGVEEEDD